MNSREAIRALTEAGYTKRQGRGSHLIMRKGSRTIVISQGAEELSSGMTAKVRSHLQKKDRP